MEATKKKKAYLKPEMNRFEIKMEAPFLVGSREDVEVVIPPTTNPEGPATVELVGLIPEPCTESVVKNLQINECTPYIVNTFNKDGKCPLWDMIEDAGLALSDKETIYIKRTDTDKYTVSRQNICN